MSRRDWAEAFDRDRPGAGLPALIGAAAIGGALVYFFLDPVKGGERRERWLAIWQEKSRSTLDAGRQAARQTAEAIKPVADRVGGQVADAVEGVKSKVASAGNTGG